MTYPWEVEACTACRLGRPALGRGRSHLHGSGKSQHGLIYLKHGAAHLDMLLQVLGALEGLATELTLVRLEGHMDADVRGDVVTLDSGGSARVPLASEVQVVGALAADMALTDVLLEVVQPRFFLSSSATGVLHRESQGWRTSGCRSSSGKSGCPRQQKPK